MATNPNAPQMPSPWQQRLISRPQDDAAFGGMQAPRSGWSNIPTDDVDNQADAGQDAPAFEGLGPLLEESDEAVFNGVHTLVRRQELLANRRWEQDQYWTYVKYGYPWVELKKYPDRDMFECVLPYGSQAITIQAIPNKTWDLCNKAMENLLIDYPQPDPQKIDDSEQAERAEDLSRRFLVINGGEHGTNDYATMQQAVSRALVTASTFIHTYNDPSGNGWVPLQIQAHPQAISPENPLVGPDGMPTTDCVLRYVTPDRQFTDDPTQADRQWMPKLKKQVLYREHVRVFPETVPVEQAEKVVLLWYTTIGDAKRRWESVAQMSDDALEQLTSWTPDFYLRLLPPSLRSRWRINYGQEGFKQTGDLDERIFFYYHVYARSTPEHPEGAEVVVSGTNKGTILHKDTLSCQVEITPKDGSGPRLEPRCLEIPLVQLTLRIDADDRDATGRPFIEMIGGADQFRSALFQGYAEVLDLTLHSERYIPSTSPVQEHQIRDSRATGRPIPILRPEDKPFYPQQPPIPSGLLDTIQYMDEQLNSMSSLNEPLQGNDQSKEISGVARQIAVQQARIGLNSMGRAIDTGACRDWRIDLEQCMKHYGVTQQLRYVGEDGQNKQVEWTGTDFALIGDVQIKQGTGTRMAPLDKVQYLGGLKNLGLISDEDAQRAAKTAYSNDLGLDESVHEQYVERCVDVWLQGPPDGWMDAAQAYQQQVAQYQALTMPIVQQHAQQDAIGQAQGGPPLPPPQLPPPPQKPWSPFAPRPNDDDPNLAMLWRHKLSKVISSVKFDAQPPQWQQVLAEKYQAAGQMLAQLTAPSAPQQGMQQLPTGPRQTPLPNPGPPQELPRAA
jgi:hypothetical protein